MDNSEDRHINPSIAGNLIFFKRVLNEFLNKEESLSVSSEVASLTRIDETFHGKISVSEEFVNKINFRYRFDRAELKEKYGVVIPKCKKSIVGYEMPDIERLSKVWLKITEYAQNNDFKLAEYITRLPFSKKKWWQLF